MVENVKNKDFDKKEVETKIEKLVKDALDKEFKRVKNFIDNNVEEKTKMLKNISKQLGIDMTKKHKNY